MNLSEGELQEAIFLHGKNFYKFMGLSQDACRRFMKEEGFLTPIEYIRKMETPQLMDLLILYGSCKKLAKRYSVSESFLSTELHSRVTLEEPIVTVIDDDKFEGELNRIGSVALASRIWSCKESVIRKRATALGLNMASIVDYKTGSNENSKGRRAEIIYQSLYPGYKDMNMVDNHNSWDFESSTGHRVDVKSSSPYKYKSYSRRMAPHFWKFSVSNLDCDIVAFMAMDEDYYSMKHLIEVPSSWIPSDLKTIVINEVAFIHFTESKGSTPLYEGAFKRLVLEGDLSDITPKDALRGK